MKLSRALCIFVISIPVLFLLFLWPVSALDRLPSPFESGPGKYPRFDSKRAEAGLTYGRDHRFDVPKTILFSLSADELVADATAWWEKGVEAFFLTGVAGDWSTDVWGTDGESWTIGVSDKNYQKVSQGIGTCRRLGCEVFLVVSFNRFFDWFDDLSWPKIEDNFRQFARFARETGCQGLAIDVEYIFPQYHFNWSGYHYENYSRSDLVELIRKRMTGVVRALYDEYPQMVLLTFPEGIYSLSSIFQASWIEEAARRNAPGGVHLCTEYTYRRPNIRYMLAQAWMNTRLIDSLLSRKGKKYWQEKGSIAAGLWPFGEDPEDFHGVAPGIEEFRQAYAAALMIGRSYCWIYSHNCRPSMLNRPQDSCPDPENKTPFMEVISKKEIITDSPFLDAARDIRQMKLRDYSSQLGVIPMTAFAGPREEGEISLMPVHVVQGSTFLKDQPFLDSLARRILQGEQPNFSKLLGVQKDWALIGPFPTESPGGIDQVFPPETEIDLTKSYPSGATSLVWRYYSGQQEKASINLASLFSPNEQVCAYAYCVIENPVEQPAHIRLGANDSCKLWLDGQLVFENHEEGRILLDKDILPTTLKAGQTSILLKVCNNRKDWGFIFRITDPEGKPLSNIKVVPLKF